MGGGRREQPVEPTADDGDAVEPVVRDRPAARRQLDDDALVAVRVDAGLVDVDQRLALRDAAEPRVHLRSAHELGEGASAVRRWAIARPQQPDGAALGERGERRVADPVEDNDLEILAQRSHARGRASRRDERDGDRSENGEQG